MKWLIASDIHGSAFWCRKLLEQFDAEGADRLLLLGDLLYHGPRNDLPTEYAPKEVIELLNARKDVLFCVRGNCEAEVDQMVLSFPCMAEYALIPVDGQMIMATHGHHFHKNAMPPLKKGDVLLHGHTHVPACEPVGDCLYMNPGSVSIPKEGSAHSYMTLQGRHLEWKTLDGNTYMEYDL